MEKSKLSSISVLAIVLVPLALSANFFYVGYAFAGKSGGWRLARESYWKMLLGTVGLVAVLWLLAGAVFWGVQLFS